VNEFVALRVEMKYGVKAWWTSESYFDTQSTFGDSTLFTGYRRENRFRPLMREHPAKARAWKNPYEG
jgi:hypothetical protein